MARARNIKPGFYKNEDLAECSVWARLIFPGLWMLADRDGRLEDRPKRIKGELLPFDAQDVEPLLRELEARGFIQRYEVDGLRAIQILKFGEHQTPHYSEKPSVIKPPALQESEAQIDAPDSKSTPGIKASSRGGRNPLNPDSLNPDSLNPEEEKPRGRASPPPKPAKAPQPPDGIDPQVWADWLQVRKGKRAGPVTETAWAGLVREASKAGITPEAAIRACCEFGWQGFNAGWYAERRAGRPGAPASTGETAWQRSQRQRVEEMTGGTVSRRPPTQQEIVDVDVPTRAIAG